MSISELSSLLEEAETGGLAAIAAASDQAGLGRARAAVLGRKAPMRCEPGWKARSNSANAPFAPLKKATGGSGSDSM